MKFRPSAPRPPRNPLVAPARFRQAGAHRQGHPRQQAEHALRLELSRLVRPKP